MFLSGIILFIFLSACKLSPNETENSGSTSTTEKVIVEASDSNQTIDITSINEFEADDNNQNPTSSFGNFEYNNTKYDKSPICLRFVMNENGNVLESKNDGSDECISYVYTLEEYEYIGNGDKIGWGDENTKLYLLDTGDIIAVYPYLMLDGDSDRDEILAKYDSDMIYGATILNKVGQ